MRTITVVTATRAEYGLLRPVVQKIAASDVLDLQLVVTGAHLCPRLGETVHEIEADGLPIAARLPIFTDNADEPVAKTIARTMEIFDNHFATHRPDAVLLLGDRFEIFAVAAAAAAQSAPAVGLAPNAAFDPMAAGPASTAAELESPPPEGTEQVKAKSKPLGSTPSATTSWAIPRTRLADVPFSDS